MGRDHPFGMLNSGRSIRLAPQTATAAASSIGLQVPAAPRESARSVAVTVSDRPYSRRSSGFFESKAPTHRPSGGSPRDVAAATRGCTSDCNGSLDWAAGIGQQATLKSRSQTGRSFGTSGTTPSNLTVVASQAAAVGRRGQRVVQNPVLLDRTVALRWRQPRTYQAFMNRSDQPASDSNPLAFLMGGGAMGSLIRSMDWSKTLLGPVAEWPQSLRTTVSICLASDLPICVIWGPGHVQLYNDAYRVICGGKHPRSMGQKFSECGKEA